MFPAAIKVDDLSYYYGSKCALNNISFNLGYGQFIALLGANGAGKTTLFSLLTRLLQPATGNIDLCGYKLQKTPGKALKKIGIVFQQSTLDLDLTVSQNLAYHGSLHGMSRQKVKQRAAIELERFDLSSRSNDKVRELNGGHRRRLEIARALLHQPELLLLDEATVGLDLETRTNLYQHIRQLCITDNISVLWTTHLVEELSPDDDILILNNGNIVDRGSAQDLITQHNASDLSALLLQSSRAT
jgi:ABC-2 type transport system ATP-binding protein